MMGFMTAPKFFVAYLKTLSSTERNDLWEWFNKLGLYQACHLLVNLAWFEKDGTFLG